MLPTATTACLCGSNQGAALVHVFPADGNGNFVSVAIDPTDAQTGAALTASTVFVTQNQGTQFQDVSGNLAGLNPGRLRTVAYLARSGDDGLAVGASNGVFVARQSDSFSVWSRLGSGLPNAPIVNLAYDPNADRLIAGSLGRGAFTIDGIFNDQVDLVFENGFESP